MLEVAVLLKEVGLVNASGRSAINIVPLFETIEDLQASAAIMDRLFALHDYRRLVDSRGAVQRLDAALHLLQEARLQRRELYAPIEQVNVEANNRQLGVYAQDVWTLNGKTTVLLGGRYNHA
eukprot:gene69065-biopygen50841